MNFDLRQFQEDFHNLLAFMQKIFIWNSKLQGITDNSAISLFYLYLFSKLTQEEIMKLTHLSRGMISILLKNLQNQRLITRTFIPGTHKHSYALCNSELPFQFSYDDLINEAAPLISSLKDFIMTSLPIVNHPFVHRIRDFLSFYEIRQQILMFEKKNANLSKNDLNTQVGSEELIQDRTVIFPKREAISNDVNFEVSLNLAPWIDLHKKFLTIMTKNSFFMISNPITKQIMACFIAEDHQTQASLVNYTGYSMSTIHRYLRKMISRGLIRKSSIKFHDQVTYEMEPVSLMETSYEKKYKQRMAEELTILKKFAMDMDYSPNSWAVLPGFAYIYALLQRVIHFLERYIATN